MIHLHYEDKGQGEALILLHGNGEDHTYFENQIDYFSSMYHVYALDTRGHGDSPRGNKPFSLEQFSKDLYDFMKQHNIQKANILGFSDGGNIALYFVLNHPEMVDHLILNGANVFPTGCKLWVRSLIELEYSVYSTFKIKSKMELLNLMRKEPYFKKYQLEKIQVPTLVIAGSNDMIEEEHTRLIHRSIPNARICILEGNHFIAQQKTARFNSVVETFLKDEFL